jgi:hypothetical protein
MRFAFLASVLLATFAACSSNSASPAPTEAGVEDSADIGTSGCTSLGGTCESFSAGCPVLQQNPELCGNVILVCCLPEGGAILSAPDAGEEQDAPGETDTGTTGGPPDSGSTPPPVDAGAPPVDSGGSPVDAGGSPVDAGHPPLDASNPTDAPTD